MENNMLLDEDELFENYIDDDEEIISYSEISYEIYTKYKDNLIYYQKLYTAVANFKYFDFLAKEITSKSKEDKLKKAMIKESSKTENYHTSLWNIATTTLFLNINFNLRTFFTDKNRNFVSHVRVDADGIAIVESTWIWMRNKWNLVKTEVKELNK